MHGAQLETYRNMQKVTLSGRELEAEVLSKAAFKLKFCQNNWNDPETRGIVGRSPQIQSENLDSFSG